MTIVDKEDFKIIAVTDPDGCEQYFPDRLALLAACGADAVILRAKALTLTEYCRTASVAATIFDDRIRPRIILHNHMEAEDESGIDEIHLSMPRLESLSRREQNRLSSFRRVGISVHSPEEAVRAVEAVSVPVYGIGGINAGNIAQLQKVGAAGACLMSAFMTCTDPSELTKQLKAALI